MRRGSGALAALLCVALGGCAGGIGSVYTPGFWVQPGKYEFLKCPELGRRSIETSDRERRLVSLMERANQDVAGPLINVGVYQVQLEQTRADLEELQRTSHEKGCQSIAPIPPNAAAANPNPAPAPAPPPRR